MARRGILVSAVLHATAVAGASVQILPNVFVLEDGSSVPHVRPAIVVDIASDAEVDQQMRIAPTVQNHVMAMVLPVAFVEAPHIAISAAAIPDAVDVDPPPPEPEESPAPSTA